MPSPPEKTSSIDIIWCVCDASEKPSKACFCKDVFPSEAENTCGDNDRPIHEGDVYARNVKRHSRSQHEDCLRLPEIIHDW
mmetsp:Transcript_94629/g.149665  ORF Transcript_94629/g.149665 Transcript_94629/m.149665 type:complete len:81 (-) Transcript_94629:355-597(-)